MLQFEKLNYQHSLNRLIPYGERAVIVRKKSDDALLDVPKTVDFVYIDGNHAFNYVILDILYWSPKVRSGGIIACHDYHDTPVRMAIDGYTYCNSINPWYKTQEKQVSAYWVQK